VKIYLLIAPQDKSFGEPT